MCARERDPKRYLLLQTRLQLDNRGAYRGLVHCTKTIAKEEGFRALYKGLTPFVTHLTLKYALRFGSFGFFKKLFAPFDPRGEREAAINFSVRTTLLGVLSPRFVYLACALSSPCAYIHTRAEIDR